MTLTAELYSPRLADALEGWLDVCSEMSPDDLGALVAGFEASAQFMSANSASGYARFYVLLADLVMAMREATWAARKEAGTDG